MTSETIQIRRYPNRRLYDRSRQRYITLPDIEELVLQGQTVEIQDSQTGEDMTRQILTQILLERHPDKIAMFPVGMLHSMLRANNLVSEFWRRYLRQSLDALENLQRSGVPFVSPLDWMSAIFPG
ncbi:MAG: polyhydroxyalkanoate synthesis regulator DNA-binding domain-containing protein, partial [Singulisphaera sp.]|nr:polyhydroxyalkanoate synthesis regulator DNA-binding domain-containing protein [Singulisphaera sp.]